MVELRGPFLLLALAACASSQPESPRAGEPVAHSTGSSRRASSPTESEAETAVTRYAPAALAGSESCRVDRVELGPARAAASNPDKIVVGAGVRGALVAWRAPDKRLAVRSVSSTARPVGDVVTIDVPADFSPNRVVAIATGYVVLGDLFRTDRRMTAVVATDPAGAPLGKAVVVDDHDRIIHDAAAAGPRSVVVLAMHSKERRPMNPEWLEIEVTKDRGVLTSSTDLEIDPLSQAKATRVFVDTAGRPAWWIPRRLDGYLVRAGRTEQIGPALLEGRGVTDAMLHPKEIVTVSLSFGPARLQRARDGATFGAAIALPEGVEVENEPVWTGAGWLVGFTGLTATPATANVAFVDCHGAPP